MKLWQLKKISTNEPLGEPQRLPENWGPIFGMSGVKDQLGDLSWVGLEDQGWFETDIDAPGTGESTLADLEWDRAKQLLKESDWAMLGDIPLTIQQRGDWIEYRAKLRDIRLQPDFPNNINWPKRPD